MGYAKLIQRYTIRNDMNMTDFQAQLNAAFSDFNLTTGFSLAEAHFYDSTSHTFSDFSPSDLSVELTRQYDAQTASSLLDHISNGKYTEPFKTWAAIPAWYFNAFSFGGIINLNVTNFCYYLSGFMNAVVSQRIDVNASLGVSCWYDALTDESSNYPGMLQQCLRLEQLKIIATFLCFDANTGNFDFSPPASDDSSVFASFWYRFVK